MTNQNSTLDLEAHLQRHNKSEENKNFPDFTSVFFLYISSPKVRK